MSPYVRPSIRHAPKNPPTQAPTHPSVRPPIHPSTHSTSHSSVRPSIHPPIHPSVRPSVRLSIYLSIFEFKYGYIYRLKSCEYYSTSRINSHLMGPFSGKPEVHPKGFSGKNILKKCSPPDSKFYPIKLTNKNVPIWCNVKFPLLFCIV